MLVATAPFAQEIQALKSELHATLSRLSVSSTHRQERHPASPWSDATTTTNDAPSTTANTPTTVRSQATTERSSLSSEADATSRILRELIATARRRRQAETQLVRELERDARGWTNASASRQQAKHEAERVSEDDARERAIQREIESLRMRRKQILQQIDDESKAEEDHARRTEQPTRAKDHTSNLAADEQRRDNQEYSIEGVVKIARLEASERAQQPTRTAIPPSVSSQLQPFPSAYAHHAQLMGLAGHHCHTEVIQDVFSIQLKFAETMLQLEKSIQMRDRLLVQPSSTSTYRRRSASSRRQAPIRRRSRQPATVYEDRERDPADESSSDVDDVVQRLGQSSDEASMSDTTSRLWRRYRLDRQPTPTGTAHSTPSTGASTAPESQPSPVNEHNAVSTPVASNNEPPLDEQFHTPSTNDSAKQVRFNDRSCVDEYPTPLIARNISFDQDSIDATTDDERPMMRRTMQAAYRSSYGPVRTKPPVLSVLSSDDEAPSFMDGSSVCSADLNDGSFLTAFMALRQEVCGRAAENKPLEPQPDLPEAVGSPDPATKISVTEKPEVVETEEDRVKLKQRKRGLTLDIQELTAKLVLAQDAATRGQVRLSLDRLRRQLRVIESHV